MPDEAQLSLLAPKAHKQWITTRNGKHRQVFVPNQAMSDLHRQLITEIRAALPHPEAAYGGIPGRSAVQHAAHHFGYKQRYFYILDLYNAYPSVRPEWVKPVLEAAKSELRLNAEGVERLMRDHVMMPGGRGLMTGLPASPDLFNQVVAQRLDRSLQEFADLHGLRYSRFLDDLVFSAPEGHPIGEKKRKAIRRIIKLSGFRLNYRKTRILDGYHQPVRITGINLNYRVSRALHSGSGGLYSDAHPYSQTLAPPGWWLKRLRGLLHLAVQGREVDPAVIEGYMGLLREIQRVGLQINSHFSMHGQLVKVWAEYYLSMHLWRPRRQLTVHEMLNRELVLVAYDRDRDPHLFRLALHLFIKSERTR